jgi:SAM-dependent methyltransferase
VKWPIKSGGEHDHGCAALRSFATVTSEPTVEAWQRHAGAWAAWARTGGHDYHYEQLNLPRFLALLPTPGRLTVDLGCGEGRLGRVLAGLGCTVIGVDSSPALARLAREAGGHRAVIEAIAYEVPLSDGCADLVTCFMALQDMDELDGAIAETARLLSPNGRLCFAVPHPFAEMTRARSGAPGYFTPHRYVDVIERGGAHTTFESWRRPLSVYTRALEQTGFVIETMREPLPDETAIAAAPDLAKWREMPLFLHVRARRS